MRTTKSDESFSYYITSEFELNQLKRLQLAIKTGKIDFENYYGKKTEYVFALDLNQKIIDWLYNISADKLERQLIAWMAILYFLNDDNRHVYEQQFYRRLFLRAKKLIEEQISKYFIVTRSLDGSYRLKKGQKLNRDQIVSKYTELCLDYFGGRPHYPLNNPFGYSYHFDEFGVVGFRIHFDYSFMYI